MSNSTHRVEVVRLGPVRKHENADTLGIVDVWGYTCVVRLADFHEGDLAAYIPPDSIVPDVPAFAFLNGRRRIRVSRLRGILSQGLLIAAPPSAVEGDDVADALGITHYEPPCPAGSNVIAPPPGDRLKYDVDTLLRFVHVFEPGEPVWVTEKLHGGSARYCWQDGQLWVGTKTRWIADGGSVPWYIAARRTPEIERFCRENPDLTLYGEVYGGMTLKYGGAGWGDARFAAFDILRGNTWLDAEGVHDLCVRHGVPMVPLIASTLFQLDDVKALAEGPSLIPGADHVREGVVVKPLRERTHPEVGRVNLKIVGNGYLSRKDS